MNPWGGTFFTRWERIVIRIWQRGPIHELSGLLTFTLHDHNNNTFSERAELWDLRNARMTQAEGPRRTLGLT